MLMSEVYMTHKFKKFKYNIPNKFVALYTTLHQCLFLKKIAL
jgi:hypothetical protein